MAFVPGECDALLACPVCGGGLRRAGNALRCQRSHSFDVARSGYVNLLTGHRRLPPGVGDTRSMLLARRRFLGRGHYERLAHAVNVLVASGLDDLGGLEDLGEAGAGVAGGEGSVIDVGSGVGYYLVRLKRWLETRCAPRLCYFGIDVAKEAARLSALGHPDIRFIVADTRRPLPLASGRALVVTSIFSPRNPTEFRRLVRPGGLVVVAFPGPDHLAELIERFELIGVHPGKEERIMEEMGVAFDLVRRQELGFQLTLGAEDLLDLIRMGPSARHLSEDALLAGVNERERETSVTASFVLLGFRPKATKI